MNHPEQSLHLAVAELLTLYPPGRSGVAWFHPPQGGKRGGKRNRRGVPIEAAILKGMGARAGVSDLVLLWGGGSAVVELKVEGGRLSPAQRDWMAWCERAGVPRFVCRSVAEVRGVVAHLVEGGMPEPRGWRANKPRPSRVLCE
jgi:hypothetical protein